LADAFQRQPPLEERAIAAQRHPHVLGVALVHLAFEMRALLRKRLRQVLHHLRHELVGAAHGAHRIVDEADLHLVPLRAEALGRLRLEQRRELLARAWLARLARLLARAAPHGARIGVLLEWLRHHALGSRRETLVRPTITRLAAHAVLFTLLAAARLRLLATVGGGSEIGRRQLAFLVHQCTSMSALAGSRAGSRTSSNSSNSAR
jgi:hypothetical protein